MTTLEEEKKIINKVHEDMFKAIDKDRINQIYHQARIWARYHHFLAEACSYERYTYLNNKFKKYRYEAINALH